VKAKSIAYWIITALFCLAMGAGGVFDVIQPGDMKADMLKTGYPDFFFKILGFWKIAGVITLIVPGLALVKEWAYAGFIFNLTGASATHYFLADPLMNQIVPIIILAIGAASYLLRPDDRRLPGTPKL